MPPVLGFSQDSWIVCDPGLPGWPAVAVVALGFWPVLTGILLAAACLALGWRLGQRRARARTEELFSRAEGQLWEAIVELRDGEFSWDFSMHRSALYAGLFGEGAPADAKSPWRNFIIPEQDAMNARAQRAMREGLGGYTQEFPIEKEGKRRWMQEHVSIRTLGEGRWSLVGVITDITPLHEAQARLREQDRLIIQTLARADCLLWRATVKVEGGAVRWLGFDMPISVLYRRLFGDRDPAMGGRLWGLLDVPDLPAMNARSTGAILSGASGYEQEFQARRDGILFSLHEQVSIAPAGPGEFHLVGVIMDMTALRSALEAHKATAAQIEHLLSRADCLLWQARVVRDESTGLRWVMYVPRSHLHRLLFGFDPGDGPQLPWAEIVAPEQAESMYQNARDAILSRAEAYEQDIHAKPGGREFWLHERVTIQMIGADEWYLVGAIFDVTDLHRAELALAAEKERLAVTLAAMSDAVITTDREGRVLFANRAAGLLLAFEAATAVGRPVAEICTFANDRGEAVSVPLDEVVRRDASVLLPAQAHHVVPGGRRAVIEGALTPVHGPAGEVVGVVIVFRDVTERERLEQEIARASKLQSVGLLAGGIAHDFNNLLTVIMGNIAVLKPAIPVEGEPATCLQEAERAVLRAKDLTQQLLTFARGGDPVRTAVHLPETIMEASAFAVRGSSVRCEVDLAPDLWPADADRGQIAQVVQNLVLNAVQSMPGGGVVRIAACNETVVHGSAPVTDGDYVRLTVTDAGCGIAPENLERIFDPYFTTKKQGSGLGLATVYSIIKKHRGTIVVTSDQAHGTAFRILLPASRRAAAPRGPTAPVVPTRLHGRILLMDDEEPIRKVGGRMLSRLGLAVETAADGAAAVEVFRAALGEGRPFDVVMLDLTVPGGMGGLEALRRMRELDPGVRAVVSSGYSNDMAMGEYRAHGFVGMIAKPYRIDDCANTLGEVLARPRVR